MSKRMKFTNSAVRPKGNLWLLSPAAARTAHESRRNGLGYLWKLEDAILLNILSFVEAKGLAMLCMTSHVMCAFASFEEHWQLACLQRAAKKGFTDFRRDPFSGYFGGSWKRSYFAGMRGADNITEARCTVSARVLVYSDVLYQPHELVHGPDAFGGSLKGPLCGRLAPSDIPDVAAFSLEYEGGIGRPVVLEGGGSSYTKSKEWDEESLRKSLGEHVFHAGGVNFKLADYFNYARTNNDIQPLYLFDPTFDRTAPELLGLYEEPAQFRDDLFSLLESRGGRPDYRWLLIGGRRSGQSWHQDPNGTSAWNVTIRGKKRWFMFPPNVTPPGVIKAREGDDCVTPLYLAEWHRGFYKEACATPGFCECETGEGDIMFVPRGWWHMVLNMDPITIAISHHFTSPAGLYSTLRLLRNAPHEVSGVDRGLAPRTNAGVPLPEVQAKDQTRRVNAGLAVHDRLVKALKEVRPEVLAAAEEEINRLNRKKAVVPQLIEKETTEFCFNFSG